MDHETGFTIPQSVPPLPQPAPIDDNTFFTYLWRLDGSQGGVAGHEEIRDDLSGTTGSSGPGTPEVSALTLQDDDTDLSAPLTLPVTADEQASSGDTSGGGGSPTLDLPSQKAAAARSSTSSTSKPQDSNRRRQQNREAQQRRRVRRKEEIAELEEKVRQLNASERSLALAEAENKRLREAVFQKELEVMVMKRARTSATTEDPNEELGDLNRAYKSLVSDISKTLEGPSKIKTEDYFQLLTKARLVCERINHLKAPGVASIVCPDLKQMLDVMRTEGIEDGQEEVTAQDLSKWISVVQSVHLTDEQIKTILDAREILIEGLQTTFAEREELNSIISSLFAESAVKLHRVLSAQRTRESVTIRSPVEASVVMSVFEKLKQNLAHERTLRHQFELVFLGTVKPEQFAAMIVAAYPEKPYCVAISNTLHQASIKGGRGIKAEDGAGAGGDAPHA